ncbi:amino acid adenylation domain-containing protein, partial [Xanthomonas sp. 1678]|uniref:amino acid adenylation domain-containing protein n=1 Tax=Xanthomonas sp. 1678 TaxID=3158788 RepID=UPI002859C254|nr:amino acid adenylation domain-containing protein [Xanthomonas translucens]
MKLAEILALCAKEGIELSVVEGALRVTAMRNKVPDSIKDVLKANKLLLIAMLGRNSIAGDEGDNLVADPSRLQGPQVVSFAQRRIWLESTLSEKAIYNTRLAGSIRSAISVPALTQALRALVQRHAVLRTVYIDDDGEPLQQVLPAAGFDVIEHDLRHLAAEAQHQFHAALLDQEMLHPFDLAADMPFRAQLLLFAPEHHELVLTIHHIATDGWSTGILLRELDELYGAFVAGTPSPLSDNAVQYVDYAAWQRGQLSGARVEALLDYWRERLADAPTLHTLPLDFPRASQQRHAGGYHLQLIGPDLQAGIRLLCAELSITPFVMLHSLFSLLVARWSGSGDVLVGSANASRGEESAQSLVGCFLNNLVLRTEVSGETTLAEFLNAQKVRFLSDLEHQQVPFELLVEQINPERSLAYHPLVQVMFGYDFRAGGDAPSASLGLQRHELDYSVSKFDLSLHAVPVDEGIEVNWGYSADLFTPATIARMADSFQTLLQAAVADPTTPVQALPMVGEAELAELSALAEGAPLQRPAPLLPHWLRSNAQQRGAQPAVLLEDHALDHAGLDARSNQFARALVAAGVRPGDRVGVCQQRTLDMVASVLGTLKAGAVYVPLDPGYPDARLAFLLADAGIGHVLAEEWLAAQLPLSGQTVVAVEAADAQSAAAFDSPVTRESAAYMIHTSGSTGQPKGVLVEHGALADKLAALAQQYGLGEDERGLLFASMSFDASLSQLLAPLCVGGSVVLRPDGMSEPEAVLAHVRAQRVTWLHVVPAYLRQLLEVDDWSGTALRRVSCGGDVLDRGLQQAWFGAGRAGIALYNSYGPTEITITASVHEVDAAQAVVPIGRPLPGGRYWVLDGQGRVLPRGAVGELCIGGRSLARGYWNRPELSGERFVTLEPLPGRVERVYRSGDRVRWNAAGELEFVGRSDHQVKVRGHRIELGEVEAALQACPGVAAAVVKLEQDSLWAYVELTESTAGQVEAALAERLPAHLLPSGYEVVGEWPLTRSGKLDRAALVRGQGAAALRRGPSTAVEQALLEIWTALLKREDIAVTDNFFQKGGHSLLATRLASQIRRRFEVAFTLKSLFELPSIEEQAALVLAQRSADASGDARLPTIPRLQHDRPVPLSFAQNRLWLLAELENASSAYNSPTAMAIDGTLDEPALERALAALVQRHEVLRTVIRDGDGDAGPVQVVLEQGRFRLAREDVSALAPEAQQQRIAALVQHSAAQPFDLSADLLLRGCLVRCAGDRHVLVLTLHHIACDGWSMAVLARELSALYA